LFNASYRIDHDQIMAAGFGKRFAGGEANIRASQEFYN